MSSIPKHLQGILWSADVTKLDPERDKHYIIHQVLQYGTFSDIKWLFDTYTRQEVANLFIRNPSKMYFKPVYYFVKNYVLGLKDVELDEDAYTTSISGPIRQRTANSL